MAFGEESDGDSAAFVTALVRHQRRIYLFIASLLPNPSGDLGRTQHDEWRRTDQ